VANQAHTLCVAATVPAVGGWWIAIAVIALVAAALGLGMRQRPTTPRV
jgi:hypothetical protein